MTYTDKKTIEKLVDEKEILPDLAYNLNELLDYFAEYGEFETEEELADIIGKMCARQEIPLVDISGEGTTQQNRIAAEQYENDDIYLSVTIDVGDHPYVVQLTSSGVATDLHEALESNEYYKNVDLSEIDKVVPYYEDHGRSQAD